MKGISGLHRVKIFSFRQESKLILSLKETLLFFIGWVLSCIRGITLG